MGKVTKLDLLHLLGHHGHYFESACYHPEGVLHAGLRPGISQKYCHDGLAGRRVRHSTRALSLVLGLLLLQRRVWHSTEGALPLVLLLALLARRAGPSGLSPLQLDRRA